MVKKFNRDKNQFVENKAYKWMKNHAQQRRQFGSQPNQTNNDTDVCDSNIRYLLELILLPQSPLLLPLRYLKHVVVVEPKLVGNGLMVVGMHNMVNQLNDLLYKTLSINLTITIKGVKQM